MRRQRGSALILTLLLAIAATTAVLTMANLTSQNAKQESNREAQVKARLGMEGALARVEQSFDDGTMSLGSNTTYTIGGVTWTTNTIDYSSTLAKSYQVTVSGSVGGKSYARTFVIGNPYERGPFHFAVFTNKNFNISKLLTTSASPAGSLAVNGSIDVKADACSIGGNVEVTGNVTQTKTWTVSGTVKTVSAIPTTGTITATDYTSSPNRILVTSTVAGLTFAAATELFTRNGNLTISGVVRNKGTIFVNGDVSVAANVTYFDANAALAVIATGKITVLGSVTSIAGLYWAGKGIQLSGNATPLSAPRTVFAATEDLNIDRELSITFDNRAVASQQFGYDMKLPRYWP